MEINNFGPFNSDVWGTVSDWTMVLVTIATAIFVWRTLNSQMHVQKLQHQVVSIEMNRHRLELLPAFNLTATEVDSEAEDPDDNVAKFITFKFRLSDNTCNDLILNIWTSPDKFKIHNKLPIKHSFVNINTDIGLFGKFTTKSFEELEHEWACNVFFELEYKDALMNKYTQLIGYTISNDGNTIDNHSPILITGTHTN